MGRDVINKQFAVGQICGEVDVIVAIPVQIPPNDRTFLSTIEAKSIIDLVKEDVTHSLKTIVCERLLARDEEPIQLCIWLPHTIRVVKDPCVRRSSVTIDDLDLFFLPSILIISVCPRCRDEVLSLTLFTQLKANTLSILVVCLLNCRVSSHQSSVTTIHLNMRTSQKSD